MKFKDYVLWILVMTSLLLGIYNTISIIEISSIIEWQEKINDGLLTTQSVILEILDTITGTVADEFMEKLLNLNKLLII